MTPSLLANSTESQAAEITQLIFRVSLLGVTGGDAFVNAALSLAKTLRGEAGPSRPALPDWASAMTLPTEATVRREIESLEVAIAERTAAARAKRELLADISLRKLLFAGQGAPLLAQVVWALGRLGFQIVSSVGNRADIVATLGDVPFVVEVKGKKKSADETDVGQLWKWEGEYVEQNNGVVPRCILVVNAFWEEPLQDRLAPRHNPAFPVGVVKLATSRRYKLVTGLQLFNMVAAVDGGTASAGQIADLLMSTDGLVPGYDYTPVAAVQSKPGSDPKVGRK